MLVIECLIAGKMTTLVLTIIYVLRLSTSPSDASKQTGRRFLKNPLICYVFLLDELNLIREQQ